MREEETVFHHMCAAADTCALYFCLHKEAQDDDSKMPQLTEAHGNLAVDVLASSCQHLHNAHHGHGYGVFMLAKKDK
jgi:hypothetical protein